MVPLTDFQTDRQVQTTNIPISSTVMESRVITLKGGSLRLKCKLIVYNSREGMKIKRNNHSISKLIYEDKKVPNSDNIETK